MTQGERVKAIRKAKEMSMEQFGERIWQYIQINYF